MNPRYSVVATKARNRCEYCRAPEGIFNLPFEVEHIVPRSKAGTDDESNWALACRSCNLFKSDHIDGLDASTGERARLFHPRLDRWEDHFRIEAESGVIEGLTPTGRVTVDLFQMNRPVQLAARLHWMRLRLFP
jgi:hypothetical protein